MLRLNRIARPAIRNQVRRLNTDPNRAKPFTEQSSLTKNQQWAMLGVGAAVAGWGIWRFYIHPKNQRVAKAPAKVKTTYEIKKKD